MLISSFFLYIFVLFEFKKMLHIFILLNKIANKSFHLFLQEFLHVTFLYESFNTTGKPLWKITQVFNLSLTFQLLTWNHPKTNWIHYRTVQKVLKRTYFLLFCHDWMWSWHVMTWPWCAAWSGAWATTSWSSPPSARGSASSPS